MTKSLKDRKSGGKISGFLKTVALLTGITLFSFLTSCRNSPSVLGVEVLPDETDLTVHYIIWNGVYGYSVLEDSVRTDDLPYNLIGSMYDSTFGVSTAGMAAQFVLSSNGVSFGKNPQLDSMILEIAYKGDLYGDSSTIQTLHIYELDQDIYYDSAYYSNMDLQTLPTDYANLQFTPAPHDSVIVGNDTLPPMMRINLSAVNPELAEKILNADSAQLADNESFVEFFKGLYITTEPVTNGGAIFSIDMLSRWSRLSLYFSNDDDDSLLYNFYVAQAASPRINLYKHNYDLASSDFKQQVLQGDTLLGQQKFYAQGIAGVKSIIKIPDLHNHDSLEYEHIAINEVKLFLPGLGNNRYPPARLALVRILEDGSYEPLLDEYEGEAYFGGQYEGGNQYRFRITRYVQKLISDGDYLNKGLYLFVSGASYKPESFTFKGNLNGEDFTGTRIEILYTIVE
jgi:hypothetical protein